MLEFKLVDGKIILTIHMGHYTEEHDVTEKVMPVVDDYLDERLGLTDYKYTNGKLSYEGKDKNKYK